MARRRALRGSIRASTPDREKISPIGARLIRLANPARNFSGVGPGRPTVGSCTTAPPPIPKGSPGAKKRSGCGGTRRRRNGQATMCRITSRPNRLMTKRNRARRAWMRFPEPHPRSEEHTSELQSHHDLVCRLLLEKKKKNTKKNNTYEQ